MINQKKAKKLRKDLRTIGIDWKSFKGFYRHAKDNIDTIGKVRREITLE